MSSDEWHLLTGGIPRLRRLHEIFLLQRDDMRRARLHLRRRLDAYTAQLASACDRETNLQVSINDILSEADLNAKARRPHAE
ncbi:hypothetical protein ABZ922_18990 [Streptomyces shenzhenensis]|uniref:hypothetical protein n=1 Tax=Streptomyces shenzhenensis TaxID=943815 RepID=UPI00340C4F78